MMLYRFARADAMQGHRFTDDVAICLAWTKNQAIQKFSRMYADIGPGEVYRVRWRYIIRGIALTDY